MKIDKLEEVYDSCIAQNYIQKKADVDIDLIKSLIDVDDAINYVKNKINDIPEKSHQWTYVLRDYYEILRSLIEAFLLFDKISSSNHQCNNAYLCIKHPELELSWEFLETIRLVRNRINYRGKRLIKEDWSDFKLKFEIYIKTFRKSIQDKLKD